MSTATRVIRKLTEFVFGVPAAGQVPLWSAVNNRAEFTALAISNVTGLQAALDNLQTNINGKTAIGHTHAGTDITSGTVADGRLSANVALLNVANVFTQPITLPDGTAAAPSLKFATALTTGLYRAGATAMGIAGGGVVRMNISENVTVGGTLSAGVLDATNINGTSTISGSLMMTDGTGEGYSVFTDGMGIYTHRWFGVPEGGQEYIPAAATDLATVILLANSLRGFTNGRGLTIT